MGKVYDDWGRLVEVVLDREKLRELAMCHSRESSIGSDGSSRFGFCNTSVLDVYRFFFCDGPLELDPERLALYEASPSFSDVPQSEWLELFIIKAVKCCVVYDFSDPVKDLKEKEIKRQTLLELVDYMTSPNVEFMHVIMRPIVKMVSVNIFRDFKEENIPVFESAWPRWQTKKNVAAVSDQENSPLQGYESVSLNPAWPHLQIVYELLLKFVASTEADAPFVAKFYINQTFIVKLLDLFDSEDHRERKFLKIILLRVYEKFMVHRPFIWNAINNIFYPFVCVTRKHNGVVEILEFIGSIIDGCSLPPHSLQEMCKVLMPLHKPKCLVGYHRELSYCLVEFVKRDYNLAALVIEGLMKYWPVANSSMEYLFLVDLEEILKVTQEAEFRRFIAPVFHNVSRCLVSSNDQVAERAALFRWKAETQ